MITKEQEKIIEDVKKDWSNFFWSNIGKEVDKEKFEEGIRWLHEDILKKPVPKIIYCDSPREYGEMSYPPDSFNCYIMKMKEFIFSISESIDEGIKIFFGTLISKRLDNDIMKFPRRIDGSFYSYLRNNIPVLSFLCYNWISYLDCYDKMKYLNSPEFIKYRELMKSGVFMSLYEDNYSYLYTIQPPISVQIENNLLHSLKDSSLKFRDGTEYYFIRGVEIEECIFKKIQDKSITLEEVLKISNEEVKSAALLMYQVLHGESAAYQFISKSLKEVDSYFHKTGDKTLCYTLFKGRIGEDEVAYVRCYCPSTDRMFFLGVDSRNTDAKNAIASLYRIPKRLKNHIKYINRQGERFTTVLTRYGERIRKNMTKEELSDLTTISGDDYFKLMKYEY